MKPTLSHLHALVIAVATLLATVAATAAESIWNMSTDELIEAFDKSSDMQARAGYFHVINTRFERVELTAEQALNMLDLLFEALPDDDAWNVEWEEFIIAARDLNLVTDAEWNAFQQRMQDLDVRLVDHAHWNDPVNTRKGAEIDHRFARRIRDGEVTKANRQRLTPFVISRHEQYRDGGASITALYDIDEISEDAWRAYLRRLPRIGIRQTHPHPLGLPPGLNLALYQEGGSRFLVTFTHVGTTINGAAHWKDVHRINLFGMWMNPLRFDQWTYLARSDADRTIEGLRKHMATDFAPEAYGDYQLISKWDVRVVDVGRDNLWQVRGDFKNFETEEINPYEIEGANVGAIVEFPMSVEKTIEVRPVESIEWFSDPEISNLLRQRLETMLPDPDRKIREFSPAKEAQVADEMVNGCDFIFDIVAVVNGEGHRIGSMFWGAYEERVKQYARWEIESKCHVSISDLYDIDEEITHADIIFRPSELIAQFWPHGRRIWSEPVRFDNVEISDW